MWQPIVDKLQRQSESERIKQLENAVRAQKKDIVDLKEHVKELEKKYDKETI